MTVEQWLLENLPKKDKISTDAAEILIRAAWKAAKESALAEDRRRRLHELHGDDI